MKKLAQMKTEIASMEEVFQARPDDPESSLALVDKTRLNEIHDSYQITKMTKMLMNRISEHGDDYDAARPFLQGEILESRNHFGKDWLYENVLPKCLAKHVKKILDSKGKKPKKAAAKK